MSTPTSIDEVVKDFERAWKRGEFEEEPNRPRLLHASNFLREKLPTLVEQAKGELDTLVKSGDWEIESTGDGWRAYYQADYENPIWKPTLNELVSAARTISSDSKNV